MSKEKRNPAGILVTGKQQIQNPAKKIKPKTPADYKAERQKEFEKHRAKFQPEEIKPAELVSPSHAASLIRKSGVSSQPHTPIKKTSNSTVNMLQRMSRQPASPSSPSDRRLQMVEGNVEEAEQYLNQLGAYEDSPSPLTPTPLPRPNYPVVKSGSFYIIPHPPSSAENQHGDGNDERQSSELRAKR